MSQTTFVAGYCQLRVDTGSNHALADLGITVNGVTITERKYLSPVFCDIKGGEEGGPTDKQMMDQMDIITIDMIRWDASVVETLRERMMASTSAGTVGTPGTLLIGGGYSSRLLINSVGLVRNYPIVLFSDPTEYTVGTKATRMRMTGEAYKNETTGVLWNASAS